MTYLKRLPLAGATLLSLPLLIVIPPSGASATPDCGSVKENGRVATPAHVRVPEACVRPGAKLWIGNAQFEVPRRGQGVEMHDIIEPGARGQDVSFSSINGELIIAAEDQVSGASASASSPSACSDSAKAWSGNRNNGYEYYVSSAELPTGVSLTDFSVEIDRAHNVINTLSNDCGLAISSSLVSVNITRKGSTGLRALYTDGSCAGDSYDVIDFGYLPSGVVGRSCTSWTPVPFADNRINEADIRLNRANKWFRYLPSGCSFAFEMAGVLTHEMGHSFGMSHVSEADHGQLTMSTSATPCSYADSSWGRGDYNNLREHYA